ncbi:MAG: hypothetical protein QOE70_4623 [Chthoniobacter sp.]|jgi:hypothetical protein|nr:hypothetical protein [Chthoniobacter sp.]
MDTTVAGISDVKMTLREKDAEDGEYLFELNGAPATLAGHGYFTTTIEVESDPPNDAMGDDSIVSLQLLGEISFVHAGEARSSASFRYQVKIARVSHIDETTSPQHSAQVAQFHEVLRGLLQVRGCYEPLQLDINGIVFAPKKSNEEIEEEDEQAHGDVFTMVAGVTG